MSWDRARAYYVLAERSRAVSLDNDVGESNNSKGGGEGGWIGRAAVQLERPGLSIVIISPRRSTFKRQGV
jgi:hypothetical protein